LVELGLCCCFPLPVPHKVAIGIRVFQPFRPAGDLPFLYSRRILGFIAGEQLFTICNNCLRLFAARRPHRLFPPPDKLALIGLTPSIRMASSTGAPKEVAVGEANIICGCEPIGAFPAESWSSHRDKKRQDFFHSSFPHVWTIARCQENHAIHRYRPRAPSR
jgi:hypothetical protein